MYRKLSLFLLIFLCMFAVFGVAYAAISLPSPIQNTVRYLQGVLSITSNGGPAGVPSVRIDSQGITVLQAGTSTIQMVPGAFAPGVITRADLNFPVIVQSTSCLNGFVYAINREGKGFCRQVSASDIAASLYNSYQSRIQGPCPQYYFMQGVSITGAVLCSKTQTGSIDDLITTGLLLDILDGEYQEKFDQPCTTGSYVVGFTGTDKVVCRNSAINRSDIAACSPGFALVSMSSTGAICAPRVSGNLCPGGTVVVGHNASGDVVCAAPVLPLCPVGTYFIGGSMTSEYTGPGTPPYCRSFAATVGCPAGQWIRGWNGTVPVCESINDNCPAGQYVYALAGNDLLCTPIPTMGMVGSCPSGKYLQSISSTGALVCAAYPIVAPSPVTGSCATVAAGFCQGGSTLKTGDNNLTCGANRTWTCQGFHGGGNSPVCSESNPSCAVPITGQCSAAPGGCIRPRRKTDNGLTTFPNTRQWTCLGTGGAPDSPLCTHVNSGSHCTGSWSAWSPYGACIAGSQDRTRTYTVTTPAANGGNACPHTNLQVQTDSQGCTLGCASNQEWNGTACDCPSATPVWNGSMCVSVSPPPVCPNPLDSAIGMTCTEGSYVPGSYSSAKGGNAPKRDCTNGTTTIQCSCIGYGVPNGDCYN